MSALSLLLGVFVDCDCGSMVLTDEGRQRYYYGSMIQRRQALWKAELSVTWRMRQDGASSSKVDALDRITAEHGAHEKGAAPLQVGLEIYRCIG